MAAAASVERMVAMVEALAAQVDKVARACGVMTAMVTVVAPSRSSLPRMCQHRQTWTGDQLNKSPPRQVCSHPWTRRCLDMPARTRARLMRVLARLVKPRLFHPHQAATPPNKERQPMPLFPSRKATMGQQCLQRLIHMATGGPLRLLCEPHVPPSALLPCKIRKCCP